MFTKLFSRAFGLLAVALTVTAAACGGSNPNPLAPAMAVTAEPGAEPGAYSAPIRNVAQSLTSSTTPIFIAGGGKTNYTCSDLAAVYAPGSEWFSVKLDQAPNGSHTITDGVISIGITNGTSAGFNFTSTMPVDAVFVKSGSLGHNLYRFSPESAGQSGLITPTKQAISHLTFCYDVELLVSKTAATTFTRDYDWTIAKSVDQPSVTVAHGGSATVNYSVAVAKDNGTDSDWAVSGTVKVTNPHPTMAASGVSVSDNLSNFGGVALTCPSTSLAPLASMTCSYGIALPNGVARTNTAVADSTTFGIVKGEGSAAVAFVTPTTVLDNAVTVTDTFDAAGLPSSAIPASQTFTYARPIPATSFASCGVPVTLGNTASIATDDGGTRASSASVSATLTCPPPPPPPPVIVVVPPTPSVGCAYSQGYWSTHSIVGPAPYNSTWALLGEHNMFYLSGRTNIQQSKLPANGYGYNILANQYIATKLNMLNGASAPTGIDLASVENLFLTTTLSQVEASPELRAKAISWGAILDKYNNGLLNVAHCGS